VGANTGNSLTATAVLGALRSSGRVMRWGFTALVALYLGSGVTRVGPNENALVLRLGKLQPQVHPPGLLWAWPVPVDEVIRVPVRSTLELRLDRWGAPPAGDATNAVAATMHPVRDGYTLTGDANIIHARLTARYQLTDPVAAVLTAQQRDALIEAAVYQAYAQALAAAPVDEALTTGRDAVRQEAQRLAQEALDRLGLGAQLLALELRELLPARPVLPAFQEVISAQVEARTLAQQAESYRAEMLPAAQAESYRLRQTATAAARGQVARARGEATAFKALLAEYRLNPAVTRARLRAETLDAIGPGLKTTVTPPNAPVRVWLPGSGGAR